MQRTTRSLNNHSFPCVVADQHREYCSKSFPTIEKHNEHLKRCHSPMYWCKRCLQKFNTSLPEGPLELAKAEHDKKECRRTPSPENLQFRNTHWIMDEEQYHRFKVVGWKKTHIPITKFAKRGKEPLSKTSWRKIRETIFPGSEEAFPGSEEAAIELSAEPPTSYQTTEDVMAIVERRVSVMPQLPDIREPSNDPRRRSRLVPIPPSTTDVSQRSTQFSWETDSQTQPSSHVLSHPGTDGYQEIYGAEYRNASGPGDSFAWVWPEYEGQQSSDSLNGAGGWLPELPPQILMDGDSGDPQQGSYQV